MRKVTILFILWVIVNFSVLSCAPTVSQQEYDEVSNELSAVQSQLESLQSKLSEVETLKTESEELNEQYDTMQSEYAVLQDKYNRLAGENEELQKQYDALKSEYDTLKTNYEELSKQSSATTEETPEIITEENAEQAIFELINLERKNNGLNELVWGENLYKAANSNNRNMATNQRLEEPEAGSYQEAIWTTGYDTTQGMAEAVLTIWKNNYRYKTEFLNSSMTHGAVAVYKSGEIFYITYIADIVR
jgi:uncharacterized protein YkwD